MAVLFSFCRFGRTLSGVDDWLQSVNQTSLTLARMTRRVVSRADSAHVGREGDVFGPALSLIG